MVLTILFVSLSVVLNTKNDIKDILDLDKLHSFPVNSCADLTPSILFV